MVSIVTGGAGFLGSHLCNALVDAGDELVIFDDLSSGYVRNLERSLSSGKATFVYVDVGRPSDELAQIVANATRSRPARIYHFASGGDAATASMIELALLYGARFAFASGPDAFGRLPATSVRGEEIVANAVRERGLDARTVRYFDCYGPAIDAHGDHPVVRCAEAALQERPLTMSGVARRPYALTFVSDAIDATRLAMAGGRAGDVIDVAAGDLYSLDDVARVFGSVCGGSFGASSALGADVCASTPMIDARPARALGWSPATSLERGLAATYRWLREDRLVYA